MHRMSYRAWRMCVLRGTADYDTPHMAKGEQCNCKFCQRAQTKQVRHRGPRKRPGPKPWLYRSPIIEALPLCLAYIREHGQATMSELERYLCIRAPELRNKMSRLHWGALGNKIGANTHGYTRHVTLAGKKQLQRVYCLRKTCQGCEQKRYCDKGDY